VIGAGHPPARGGDVGRALIVNADDFGLSRGVNRGVIEAHERGIVTSASLMVRWPAAPEAGAYARAHPRLSCGLHFDFGEWAYRDGKWISLYHVVDVDDPAAVAAEARRQLDAFRRFVGADPTHLDSHQHVGNRETVKPALLELSRVLAVPLRGCTSIRYCGDFYGQDDRGEPHPQGITADALRRLILDLAPGVTELGCHPGFDDDVVSMYVHERMAEIAALCDPGVRETIDAAGVTLCSFSGVLVQ
jgi:predicted glycoside hydrolase/deacetylase ChbG (UPF0249 family)